MKRIPIRGVAIVLAITLTTGGLLLIAAFSRVDTYRGLPEIMLPPVQVLGMKPGHEPNIGATPTAGRRI